MILCGLAWDEAAFLGEEAVLADTGWGVRTPASFSILPAQSAFIHPDYLMATALTSLNVVWPSRTFWTPSCMRVVIPS